MKIYLCLTLLMLLSTACVSGGERWSKSETTMRTTEALVGEIDHTLKRNAPPRKPEAATPALVDHLYALLERSRLQLDALKVDLQQAEQNAQEHYTARLDAESKISEYAEDASAWQVAVWFFWSAIALVVAGLIAYLYFRVKAGAIVVPEILAGLLKR